MFIDKNTINKIRQVAISSVLSKYLVLDNRKALCPFHNEKTPSLSFHADKNIFTCFGCGESGSPIDFVMKYCRVNFLDACKIIAKDFSIYIPDRPPKKPFNLPIKKGVSLKTPRTVKPVNNEWKEKASLFVDYCHQQLLEKTFVLDYLSARGINRPLVERYKIGYNDKDRNRAGRDWGLGAGKIWLPEGIVIPMIDGNFVRLRIRISKQKGKSMKYAIVSGSSQKTFIIPAVDNRVVFLFESELDLIAFRGLFNYTAMSFGSSVVRPCEKASKILEKASKIVVAYDNDEAGKRGFDNLLSYMDGRFDHHMDNIIYYPTRHAKDFGDSLKDPTFDSKRWVKLVLPDVVKNFPVDQDLHEQRGLF